MASLSKHVLANHWDTIITMPPDECTAASLTPQNTLDLSTSEKELISKIFKETLELVCPNESSLHFQFFSVFNSKFRQTLTKECKTISIQEPIFDKPTIIDEKILITTQRHFDHLILDIFSSLSRQHPHTVAKLPKESLCFSSQDVSLKLHKKKIHSIAFELQKLTPLEMDSQNLLRIEFLCNALIQTHIDLCEVEQVRSHEKSYNLPNLSLFQILTPKKFCDHPIGNVFIFIPESVEILFYKIPILGNGRPEWDLEKSWFLIRHPDGKVAKFTKDYSKGRENPQFVQQSHFTKVFKTLVELEEVQEIFTGEVYENYDHNLKLLEDALTTSKLPPENIPTSLPVSIKSTLQLLRKIFHEINHGNEPINEKSTPQLNEKIPPLNDRLIETTLHFLATPRGCEFLDLYIQPHAGTISNIFKEHSFDLAYMLKLQKIIHLLFTKP